MQKKSDTQTVYALTTPWTLESHNVWLASTLSLRRNLAKYKFPAKLDSAREEQVISLLFEALKKSPEFTSPRLYRANALNPTEKEYLSEHFLSLEPLQQAHGTEGFVVDESGKILAVINLGDHLELVILDTQQEIEKSWNRLIKIEETVGKHVDLAFNSQFGFLSHNPAKSGTGLEITLFLHIPAVIHSGELSELLEKEKEEEIEATGLQGSPTEMIGDLLMAKNRCSLGLTEEYILTSLRMWATRAVVAEVSLRKKIKENGHEPIKNKVTRALGLLTHSYQLDLVEALNSLSLVKLGIELGWVKAPTAFNFNEVFFGCRRAHFLHQLQQPTDVPELPRKRAEYLHQLASQLTLAI